MWKQFDIIYLITGVLRIAAKIHSKKDWEIFIAKMEKDSDTNPNKLTKQQIIEKLKSSVFNPESGAFSYGGYYGKEINLGKWALQERIDLSIK
jgi:hypothetical protein